MPYLINTDVPVGSALNRLGSLIDVEINNPLSKDVLSYDPTTNTWVNDDAIGNIVSLTQAEYDALTQEEKMDSKKYYYITDDTITGAPVDDDDVSPTKVWSSQKVDGEIDSLNSALTSTVTIPSPAPASVSLNTIRKRANIVQVNLRYATITPSSNGWVILGNLPADFLNADVVDLIVPDNTSNTEYKSVICRIEADGTIRMWGIANKGVQPCISATFIGK